MRTWSSWAKIVLTGTMASKWPRWKVDIMGDDVINSIGEAIIRLTGSIIFYTFKYGAGFQMILSHLKNPEPRWDPMTN